MSSAVFQYTNMNEKELCPNGETFMNTLNEKEAERALHECMAQRGLSEDEV